jgi:hypothetical protein
MPRLRCLALTDEHAVFVNVIRARRGRYQQGEERKQHDGAADCGRTGL